MKNKSADGLQMTTIGGIRLVRVSESVWATEFDRSVTFMRRQLNGLGVRWFYPHPTDQWPAELTLAKAIRAWKALPVCASQLPVDKLKQGAARMVIERETKEAGFRAEREAKRTKATAKSWERIPRHTIPRCDLCDAEAHWRHPAGGLRCANCPRPNE